MLEENLRPQKPGFEAYGQLFPRQIVGLRAIKGAREGSDETWTLSPF